MISLVLNWMYQPFTGAVNTGSSPESRHLEEKVSEIVHHFRRRVERDKAFSDLARVVEGGNKPNWDRYGGQPVQSRVPQLACRFLNALPSVIPTPEVGLDPDGEISFDWIVSRDRQLTVSISPEGELNYAGIYGAAVKHGRELFDDSVPHEIIEAIRRLGYRF